MIIFPSFIALLLALTLLPFTPAIILIVIIIKACNYIQQISVNTSSPRKPFIPPSVLEQIRQRDQEYQASAYYQITHLPYSTMQSDAGRYGEYLIYAHLKYLEAYGARFLFNVYTPKPNGQTTEIDVLMICPKGIFVFESKNLSGWIFGNENQQHWYQTLRGGKWQAHCNKISFYNPVMQNAAHIKHLKRFLGEQIPMHSIIVFSDRCTLQSIQMYSQNIRVIQRYEVTSAVTDIWNRIPMEILDESHIADIYSKLYPYTQVNAFTKAQHDKEVSNFAIRP